MAMGKLGAGGRGFGKQGSAHLGSASGSIGPTPGTPVLTWTSATTDLTPDGTVTFDNIPVAGDTLTSQIQAAGGDWSSPVINTTHVITSDEDLINEIDLNNTALTAGSYDWRVRITHNGAPSDWSNVETKTLTSFTPASLTPNAWFEVRLGGLFQSNAGSTAASANNDVVGYLPDQSGNSFTLTSLANDTSRPTLQGVGSFPYLNFDGVNDLLRRTAALGSWAAGAASWFFAIRSGTIAAANYLAGEYSSSNGSTMYVPGTQSMNASPFTRAGGSIRDDAGSSTGMLLNNAIQSGVFDGSDHVWGVVDNGSSLTPYLDGVAGTPVAYTRGSHVLTPSLFSIGAMLRSTNPSGVAFMPVRFYGAVLCNHVITPTEAANLSTHLGILQGRTI